VNTGVMSDKEAALQRVRPSNDLFTHTETASAEIGSEALVPPLNSTFRDGQSGRLDHLQQVASRPGALLPE
jgi:hypothetical protein